jgi:hypothetical protein
MYLVHSYLFVHVFMYVGMYRFQVDQIGQILAQCVTVYFGQFFLNYRCSQHFLAIFSTIKITRQF